MKVLAYPSSTHCDSLTFQNISFVNKAKLVEKIELYIMQPLEERTRDS